MMNHRHRKNFVLEVDCDSTHLIFGTGARLEEDLTRHGYLEDCGTDFLLLEDPFDVIDVALARNEVKTWFTDKIRRMVLEAVKGRHVLLGRHSFLEMWLDIERKRRTEEGQSDARLTEIPLELLAWYLAPEGLTYLQGLQEKGTYVLQYGEDAIEELVRRLIVIQEVAQYLQLSTFHLGATSGATLAGLDELAREQIQRHSQEYAERLHEIYASQFPKVEARLKALFPQISLSGRVKCVASIADKLNRKAMRTEGRRYDMQNLEQAQQLIRDGHGMSLVLESASRENIAYVRDRLIGAMLAGELQILEIKNYHAEALPYLTTEDIALIQQAVTLMQQSPAIDIPDFQPHPPLTVLDGSEAVKPSGYTTTQIVLMLRNQESGRFDWPTCELQIRGKHVDTFYAAEHLVHDARLGKDSYKNAEVIRKRLEPKLKPLLSAIEEMSESQFSQYTHYLSQYYVHCRKLESNLPTHEPQPPVDLPAICTIDNLKSLSHKQKKLIQQHQQVTQLAGRA